MNKLALATILLLIAFIALIPDDTSEPMGFCNATGVIKTISQTDAKKLLKLGKILKKQHDDWIELVSVDY